MYELVHEWALAEALIEYLRNYMKSVNGRYVEKLVIGLGKLQSIDKEIFSFALTELLKQEGIIVNSIEFVEEDILFKCRKCGYLWKIDLNEFDEWIRESIHFVPEAVHSFIKCPRCGSHDFEVVRGRGVRVLEVVIR